MSMIHSSANVESNCEIGEGVRIWANAHIRSGCRLRDKVIIGEGVYVGPDVEIGENSKVQNNALIYEPAVIGSGVFIGPAAVLTNDQYPRAVNPDGAQKDASGWTPVGVIVHDGASIGAGAICIAPLRIGRWAVVGSGAIVTRDVLPYALVVGSPARQIGWVGEAGYPLVELTNGEYICPKTSAKYLVTESGLSPVA